jgi:TonB family protein
MLILAGFALLLGNPIRPQTAPEVEVSLADMGQGAPGGGENGVAHGSGMGKEHASLASGTRLAASTSQAVALSKPHAKRPRKRVPSIDHNPRTMPLDRRMENIEAEPSGHQQYETHEAGAIARVSEQPSSRQAPRTAIASLGNATPNANGGSGTGASVGAGAGNGAGGDSASGLGGGNQVYDTVEYPPVPLSRVMPAYPGAARASGIEGEVVLRAIVDQHGAVEPDIVVVQSVPQLDQAAIQALRHWRFEPGRDAGDHPVRVLIEVPLRFRLR